MTRAEQSMVRELRAEVKRQRAWLTRLARALHTHTRTDLAPDAALPAMRQLVNELSGKPKRVGR